MEEDFSNLVKPPNDQLVVEDFYRCCHVHFKRSAVRIRRNAAIVPADKEMQFYDLTIRLLVNQPMRDFQAIVKQLKKEKNIRAQSNGSIGTYSQAGQQLYFRLYQQQTSLGLMTIQTHRSHWVVISSEHLARRGLALKMLLTTCGDTACRMRWIM
jgi:hypothetical protein